MKLKLDTYDGHKIRKAEFAEKVGKTMLEIKSSFVFFVLQQAFGDMEWITAEEILRGVIEKYKEGKE